MIRQHIISHWKDGQKIDTGFLFDPPGHITLYGKGPHQIPYTAATLPEGWQICPNLTMTNVFSPPHVQEEVRQVARKYGYELFEIDIVPWPTVYAGGNYPPSKDD